MPSHHFLLELGTEELPPKLLTELGSSLAEQMAIAFTENELEHNGIQYFVTPRRLAVLVKDLAERQPDRTIERKGPKVEAAYDDTGQPTKACVGFAEACGTTPEQLETRKFGKDERLYFSQKQKGEATLNLLPEIVHKVLHQLPLSKTMRWGDNETVFVRPVHWITHIYGHQCVPIRLFKHDAQSCTYGHRFHYPQAIAIDDPANYATLLQDQGYVIADFEQRQQNIRHQIEVQIPQPHRALIDEALLAEVTGLVEWPVVLIGQFDERFLAMPPEILITAMNKHQKSFAVVDENDTLLPQFVTVANIESKKPEQVIAGNERVIRARLADAEFFYNKDLKTPLKERIEPLKQVIFQNQLGSLYEKAMRLARLARDFADELDASTERAERAAWLAKTDLLTEIIDEFPELQGLIGYYYALDHGEDPDVAKAIAEHYRPRFSGDALPQTALGWALGLADRIDTIVGIIGIGDYPTGEKDPFGLRRAALGILRIIIENQLDFDLEKMLTKSREVYGDKLKNDNVVEEALDYIMDRLKAWYQEQGIAPQVFAAVIARYPTKPFDFHKRVHAVQQFLTLEEAASLTAANKRVSNILKKQSGIIHQKLNHHLLQETAERTLAT